MLVIRGILYRRQYYMDWREIVKCTLKECADPEVERKIQCYSFIGQGSVVEVAFFCFPFAELI